MINVSWDDAVAYAEWLSEETGKRVRLPTEAEWEYAARARTTTARFWGDNPTDACAYENVFDRANETALKTRFGKLWEVHACEDAYATSAPVGRFKPNPWGLYDMLGNVFEWVQDCYHDNYEDAPGDGSAWEPSGGSCAKRVIRGGSWFGKPRDVRSASRLKFTPDIRTFDLGFRLAQDI